MESRDIYYSSKMLAVPHSQPGMEVVPAELEVVPADGLIVYYDKSNEKYTVISDAVGSAPLPVHQDEERRNPIWRRQKAVSRLSVALSILVVIVIVVAAVAGIESSKNRNKPKGRQHSSFRRSVLLIPDRRLIMIIEQAVPTVSPKTQSTSSPSPMQSVPQTVISASRSTAILSRTLQSTTAVPSATGITPPLGESAPRDCPNSNGTIFTVASPFDVSTSTAGATRYEKICNADMAATNKTNMASFVVNSFDLCIQSCAGQMSEMAVSAVYHWADGTEVSDDKQRPGTCWCCGGIEAYTVPSDNNDAAIPISS